MFDSTKGVLIWDGAGVDTINASNATQAATIDLNQGGWSYIGEKSPHISSANQLSINLGTQIENAIGGAYDDILVGNNLSNRLEGGAGNDTLKEIGETMFYWAVPEMTHLMEEKVQIA